MFNRATRGDTPPRYLSLDHDPLYRFHQWQANLRILDVKEIKTVPYVPSAEAMHMVSGPTMTSVVCQSVQMRESHTQSQRSTARSGNRRDWDRCST